MAIVQDLMSDSKQNVRLQSLQLFFYRQTAAMKAITLYLIWSVIALGACCKQHRPAALTGPLNEAIWSLGSLLASLTRMLIDIETQVLTAV